MWCCTKIAYYQIHTLKTLPTGLMIVQEPNLKDCLQS